MRVLRTILIMVCAAAALPQASAAQARRDSALTRTLLERLRADQVVRDTIMQRLQAGEAIDSALVARQDAIDAANTAWLKEFVSRHGWPLQAQVGAEGVEAAFLLVQHADQDTAFQAQMLPRLEQAADAGELPWQQVALLVDRVAVHRGEPQQYGTQARLVGGDVVFAPIADSAQVDARRARIGLPPLRTYARLLDSLYTARDGTP